MSGPSPPDDDDPFAASADPYPPQGSPSPWPGGFGLDRRRFTQLAATAGVAGALTVLSSGCAVQRLGCAPAPSTTERCRHRFCRHYNGPV